MSTPNALPPAEALAIESLITPTAGGIASRVLARTPGGNLTLFAFDAGQELSEHTAPFDALVMVLTGAVDLTISETSTLIDRLGALAACTAKTKTLVCRGP